MNPGLPSGPKAKMPEGVRGKGPVNSLAPFGWYCKDAIANVHYLDGTPLSSAVATGGVRPSPQAGQTLLVQSKMREKAVVPPSFGG
jgi:hypothetical protein